MTEPRDRDARWQALQDALATEDDAEFAPDFDVRAQARWRDELDFYDALAKGATSEALPRDGDAALIEAALAAVPAETAARSRVRIGMITAVAAAAAIALLWVALPRGVDLRAAQGSWTTEAGDTIATGAKIPAGTWLRVADQACMARGEAQLCALAGARVRVDDPDARALELAEGTLRVESGTWHVQSAGDVHTLTEGDTLQAPESVLARAERPSAPEPTRTVERADELAPTAAQPVEREPERRRPPRYRVDAATLLAQARKALGEQRVSDAARHYEALLRRHPNSSEAKIGRISLAGLELERGRAKAALRLYTTAAKGGGIAAEEAAWGRLRALHRLHRKDQLREAVRAFAAKYPTSAYRARAQGLLQ